MTALASLLLERPLLLDGGMGTQILARRPSVDDFGGPGQEGCMEVLNERRPEWIQAIHQDYFDAGADAVETNTFGANAVVLSEFNLQHRVEDFNEQAVRLAREVARSYDRPRFVIGSVGPGTKLITLGHIGPAELFASYLAQFRGLLKGGADALLIETCQDLGQIKTAVRAARRAMAELQVQRPIWAQVTVETSGTLLLGTEIQAALAALEPLGLDVLGLNCGTGPDLMEGPLAALAEASPTLLSCLPNAGLPVNEAGNLVYPLGPEAFAAQVAGLAGRFGLNVVGGCCGTTPAHIKALGQRLSGLHLTHRTPRMERSVASLYQAVSLRQEPRPALVGERTNANGSKAFREALAREDWDGLVAIAKDQQREGAHLLDVCVAFAGRDEARDFEALIPRLATQVNLPLMLDSTELPALEKALSLAPGKCVVNSINFEDGEAKARRVLDLCRDYGAAVVGLTIDERGMARTVEEKLAVAQRLVDLVVGEYGFNPSDLILDPLTFTLAAGEEQYRRSALATLETLREIKARHHGVLTLLGVSNVSFGLKVGARQVLNALMLSEAVKAGLDLAIFNAARVLPLPKIPEEQVRIGLDLIHDRRAEGYDPLKAFMAAFEGSAANAAAVRVRPECVEARLREDILDGDKRAIEADALEALADRDPLHLINGVLLPAMKEVGDRFGAGLIQLPFVLESAEAMKAAIALIEPRLPKEASATKGRVILATVKGDVHDIGKNLVEIILKNNGWEVLNLGIKQPIEQILAHLDQWPADAIGLSGLLVKSTTIMRENLLHMADRGLKLPVLLGGAALTRDFVAQACQPGYPGPVLYAEDAFEGLSHLESLREGRVPTAAVESEPEITVVRRGEGGLPLTPEGRSSWVRPEAAPEPPFWGVREQFATCEELFEFLDSFVVVRNRWSFTQGALSDAEFEALLRDKAEPALARWKEALREEGLLKPRARWGYFPVRAEGNCLVVLDPATRAKCARFVLPRQATGRRLCIADFFGTEAESLLPLQVVTLGQEASQYAARLHAEGRYQDYFLFHGLATELTEAYAERLHAQVRRELGIQGKDAKELRQLFAQGYQGSRYSFGYPACPDLEGNAPILDLLNGKSIGITLSETFQMDPEFSTSALVAWHSQARYFSV